MENVLAILLAGGAGERLYPLTKDTAKPAVPFGGVYRIIDFTLSNCINSDVRRIFILAQYKSLELTRHIRDGWNILSPEMGEYIEVIPPMQRVSADWYQGTADAVFQNFQSIDQIYKMNYHEMLDWHREQNADITIATLRVPPEESTRYGVAKITDDYRIVGFMEKPKPADAYPSRFDSTMISASMGVYAFNTDVLLRALHEDAQDSSSSHDFGKDVIPRNLEKVRVVAYDFHDINAKQRRYWRDVGTLDAYYEANMDLVDVVPEFNLYDSRWPIRTKVTQQPPAKFVFAQEGRRMGIAVDSIVRQGRSFPAEGCCTASFLPACE
jgi:glucose-1-phosphate adenylyltransferase